MRSAGAGKSSVVTSPARVLVVDDDETIRQLVAINLELEGFDVSTASNGPEGLERAVAQRPDVVTLDVMMPGMDGFEVVSRLRADPSTAAIPVVLLTARTGGQDSRRAEASGADAVVAKPFDPVVLVDVVRRLAGGQTE